MKNETVELVELSVRKFLMGCILACAGLVALNVLGVTYKPWFLALQVMVTILALFILGSIRYRLDKNALTYGAGLVVATTFFLMWWPESALRADLSLQGPFAITSFIYEHFMTLHGLDDLIHADTMLFILGLTFFVAAIAQTRLLESISFWVLGKMDGSVFPTVAILAGLVSIASGVLDGVSMIGLMIRVMVIILVLSRCSQKAIIQIVILSTIITTVCGMWLAYGEPPNLIMKSNLYPDLDNIFFLRYCAPVAFGCYLMVAWTIYRQLRGGRIPMAELDLLDQHCADVRYYQAQRHGAVLSPLEMVEKYEDRLGKHAATVRKHLYQGESLGLALYHANVPKADRTEIFSHYVSGDLAEVIDTHYKDVKDGKADRPRDAQRMSERLAHIQADRIKSQRIGSFAFLPFIGMLIWHGWDHRVPLFWASFVGFVVAYAAIFRHKRMRDLAWKDATHEFKEYLFLLPLFLSISLLQKTGFFGSLTQILELGIEKLGASHVAYGQFWFATILSAMLDNNVVADFASHALHGLEIGLIHLFAMAQIAGYALGGCWTHVGSAQSVVAYSYIQKEIDERYTPFQWIKAITPVILQLAVVITIFIYVIGMF